MAARSGDGAAEFFGGFDPFLNDDFQVGESFLEGLSVGGAAGECRTSGAPRSYIPRTQRLRAGLKHAAPPALEEVRRLETARLP